MEILNFPHCVRGYRKGREGESGEVGWAGRGMWRMLRAKALRRAGKATVLSLSSLNECVSGWGGEGQ